MREEPPRLSDWADDEFSQFFKMAQFNERAAALNVSAIFNLMRQVDDAFRLATDAVERDSQAVLLVPRWLLVRVRSSVLAGYRLAMSGQIPETFPVLRAAIEQTWYAIHIATDPTPPSRAETWLRRGDDDQATARATQEFGVGPVRRSHEAVDAETAKQLHWLYKQTIEFGGHPNQLSMFSAMGRAEDGKQVQFQIGILYPQPVPLIMTLRMAVAIGIGALKAFARIFPERFVIVGLDNKIGNLVAGLNTVFKPYASDAD